LHGGGEVPMFIGAISTSPCIYSAERDSCKTITKTITRAL
jgi:hypothetical protein